MPRTCFVVMPFSETYVAVLKKNGRVIEALFKPAIEGAGLGYECRRSAQPAATW